MKAKLIFLLPAVAYTIAILYLSLIDLGRTPVRELGLSDKVLHIGAYFGLAVLWMLNGVSTMRNNKFFRKIVIISMIVIIFGIFIEVLQDKLTSYRQLDGYDVLANCIGVIIAGVLMWLLKTTLIRLKAKISLFFIKK